MIDTPQKALEAAWGTFAPLAEAESVPLSGSMGRVLAADQHTDRASPPADVSSMDGYAVRAGDVGAGALPVAGVATPGQPPLVLTPGMAIKIFTGACVPSGAELVIQREAATESGGAVSFSVDSAPGGQFIRRAGENAPAGHVMARAGSVVTAAVVSALASAGVTQVVVRRKVRVAVLTTGDELVPPGKAIAAYQIRDSNGPALAAMFGGEPWADVLPAGHVRDDLGALMSALEEAIERADAVLLTGGVSMGDFDHVPAAAAAVGARTVFHKLPTRPGKPLFCAVSRGGKPVVGLPGNPISVLTTARWFAMPVLRRVAGLPEERLASVRIVNPDASVLGLHHFRQVRRVGADGAELLATKGSGDVVTAAASDGFVQVPPNVRSEGRFAFYPWG